MFILIGILYIIYIIAIWRIASFLGMRACWLSIIPIANLIYFCAVVDKLNLEAYDREHSYLRYVVAICLVISAIGAILCKAIPYDITIITGRILLLSGGVFAILVSVVAYVDILADSYDHLLLAGILSIVVPFPIMLFIASFTVQAYVEEAIELYSGQ